MKSPVSEIPGSHENFKKIKMPEIAAWLSPILKGAYMEISIVGDISEDDAAAAVAKTFGALPPRERSKKNPFAEIARAPEGETASLEYLTKDEPRSVAAKLWISGGGRTFAKCARRTCCRACSTTCCAKTCARPKERFTAPSHTTAPAHG